MISPILKYFLTILLVVSVVSKGEFTDFAYQDQTADEKMKQLWDKITENIASYGWFSTISLTKIFFNDMRKSFDAYSDIILEERSKLIHSVGNVGKVEFIAEKDSPYTGIFEGCKNVILRLSVAKQPDTCKKTAESADGNFTPGFGIKFLRNSVPSANLVAMYKLDGQPSWNFFANDFSNHVGLPNALALKLLGKKFEQAQKEVGVIGLRTLAEYTEDGVKRKPIIPFKLVFRPSPEVTALFSHEYNASHVEELKKVPVGIDLYEVLAQSGPNSQLVKIGVLRTITKFTPSNWGDRYLFFQHNYIKDDYELHPEWKLPEAEYAEFMKYARGLFH